MEEKSVILEIESCVFTPTENREPSEAAILIQYIFCRKGCPVQTTERWS